MFPTEKEVQAHITKFLEQLGAFAFEEFGLEIPGIQVDLNFKITNRVGLGGRDNMGRPFMRLNLGKMISMPMQGFSEYKSLLRYSGVTSFATKDWKLWVDTLVAHEFAHVIQFTLPIYPHKLKKQGTWYDGLGYYEGGHGSFFIAIYSRLREKFVNHRIEGGRKNPLFGCKFEAFEGDRAQTLEKRIARRAKATVTAGFPHEGAKVKFRGRIFVVSEYKTSNRKFPYIGIDASGARLKMPASYIMANSVA